MSEDEPLRTSISYAARREGNDGYVHEQYSDGTERIFGPMRTNIVPTFIESRRRMWNLRMMRRGHVKVQSDTHH